MSVMLMGVDKIEYYVKNIYKVNVQNISLSLPSGIYIIKSNGKVRKVIP